MPSGSVGTSGNQSPQICTVSILKNIYLCSPSAIALYYPVSLPSPSRECFLNLLYWHCLLNSYHSFAHFPLVSTHSHHSLERAPPRLITKLLLDICTISVLILFDHFSAFDHNNDALFLEPALLLFSSFLRLILIRFL